MFPYPFKILISIKIKLDHLCHKINYLIVKKLPIKICANILNDWEKKQRKPKPHVHHIASH